MDQAAENASKLEERSFEITKSEEQKEKGMSKRRENPGDSWDTDMEPTVCVMGVLAGTDSEGAESLLEEIMAENSKI